MSTTPKPRYKDAQKQRFYASLLAWLLIVRASCITTAARVAAPATAPRFGTAMPA